MNQPFDLIIFGATSFVGEILCEYLREQDGIDDSVRWAIAGRSRDKMDKLLTRLDAKNLVCIVADAHDEQALIALCEQTKVVISTVGPYDLYGDTLVKACAATGTDYCDLAGEVRWMKRIRQQHETAAMASGARIVHCCGFDSLPSDMGVYFLQQQAKERFGEYCSRVRFRVVSASGAFSGGTVATLLNESTYLEEHPQQLPELEDIYALCPDDYQNSTFQHRLSGAEYDTYLQSWIMPFMMSPINEPVVMRSHALSHNAYGDHFTYNEAMVATDGLKGRIIASMVSSAVSLFTWMVQKRPLRNFLAKHALPSPGEGPSKEAQEKGFYNICVWGQTDSGETINIKITGDRDPGYGSTAKMLAQSGISLAQDISHDEKGGGFWTTASIFDERLIQRLRDHAGMSFERGADKSAAP